jgi:ubiquinone/menaquinone biosynthesis C-methylase UbiE
MATDYALMIRNLLSFYDFNDKTMIAIGAGGGQFVAYGHAPRRIVAIDQDAAALDQLRRAVAENGMSGKFELVQGDFLTMDVPLRGDVVLFDFCLHEMADPALALRRAGRLAPDVVVFDHGRTSRWTHYVVEEEKVKLAWEAVERLGAARSKEYSAEHKFRDHAELLAKVRVQGDVALQRIEKFRSQTNITIPLTYELALVRFPVRLER